MRRNVCAVSCMAQSRALQRSWERRERHCPHGTKELQHVPKQRSCWGRGCSTPHILELEMLHHLGCGGWESNNEKWSS